MLYLSKVMNLSLLLILVSACGTMTKPKGQSKLSNLIGSTPNIELKKIKADLKRSSYDKYIGRDQSMRSGATRFELTPYTEPLIRVEVTEDIAEKSFKENWPESKKKIETEKILKTYLNDKVVNKQCFLLSLRSSDVRATKMAHWHGTLNQNGSKDKLKFSKGTGIVQTRTSTRVTPLYGNTYTSRTSKSHTYYYAAEACSSKSIQLDKAFSVTIEPRYVTRNIPVTLEWQSPVNKTEKPGPY
ncbi:MAG: hypothetical protein AB8E15_00690 [Bdellovibrionales bacterium]